MWLQDAGALRDLQWHWGDAYEITADGHWWRAKRRDDGAELTARAAGDLRDLMLTDYIKRPVPRWNVP